MANAASDTVTVLRCPNGSTVTLVGTAHFSKDSIEDVRRTIRSVRPQVVVLELCSARKVVLTVSDEQIRQRASSLSWENIRGIIQREGLVVGITHAVFLKLSGNIMDKLGIAPGGEFRAGFEEGAKLNSTIVLGDRMIGVTFKRALHFLTLWQRIKFVYMLTHSLINEPEITPEEIEKMKSRDMVSLLIGELSSELPSLSKVFVDERDQILAHSLMRAANCVEEPYGPPRKVVGVVGIGHVTGIESYWMKACDIRHLLVVPPPSRFSVYFWLSVKYGCLGLLCAAMFWCGGRLLRSASNRGLLLNPFPHSSLFSPIQWRNS